MKRWWAVEFERVCFDFFPAVTEKVHAVFKTRFTPADVEFDDEAWKALGKQHLGWVEGDFTFKVGNRKFGWLSTTQTGKRFEVELQYDVPTV